MSAADYAEAVAKDAGEAVKQVQCRESAPLAMVEKKMTLAYRVPDEKRLEWARSLVAQIENGLPKNKGEIYAQTALILHERQTTEITLQSIRIGGLTIATLPNEVFSITGLKLKAQSPFALNFNSGLAHSGPHSSFPFRQAPTQNAANQPRAFPQYKNLVALMLRCTTGTLSGCLRPLP